ncbi:MAG: hypothetical protein WC734_00760 [Patescibacteria group bacterium]|jgi:hypothetical protein
MAQPGELGNRELNASYWYLTHKSLLRKILIIGLIAFNAVLILPLGWGVYGYISELPGSAAWADDIRSNSINWVGVHQKIKPKNITVSRTEIVPRSTGTYDIVVWLKNPNSQWFADQASVTATLAGTKSDPIEIFILPNEEKIVAIKNIRIPATTNISQETARSSVLVDSWQRLDDPRNYQLPSFSVSDTKAESLGDQYTQTRVLGHLFNRSLSGYGLVDLTVVLWNGPKAVGVATADLQNVTLNEERSFDVRFSQMYLNVTDITVSPSANNLDVDNVLDK